jgi:hypothetical protein
MTTKSIFGEPKSQSCPRCGRPLDDFQVNLENFSIQCPQCGGEFDPKTVFSDSEILLLAEYVPADKRDEFLVRHGFAKVKAERTPRWVLVGIIGILSLCGIVLGAIGLNYGWLKAIAYALVPIVLVSLILFYYLREKKPRWKRIQKLEPVQHQRRP